MKVVYLLLFILILSCKSEEERIYEKKSWEYKTKTIELDYLRDLQRIKSHVEYLEAIRELDSLIKNR